MFHMAHSKTGLKVNFNKKILLRRKQVFSKDKAEEIVQRKINFHTRERDCGKKWPCRLDNHSTHSSLASYNFFRNCGIHLPSPSPHTSHRTQHLNLTFFKPLEAAYQQECDKYIKNLNYDKIKD